VVALQGGTMAIACYQDAMIRFFDLVNKTEKATITSGLFDAYSLALSPGEDVLVSGNSHGEINIWSMQEGYEKIGSLPTQSRFILNTTFSIDGKLSTSSIDGAIHLFDMNTQQLIYKHDYHSLPVRSTAFSPNGDGNNDVFEVVNLDKALLTSFVIYNRWGVVVYDNSVEGSWDGTFKTEQQPREVYIYVISWKNPFGGNDITKRGSITLLR
jgi:gliding motility-associated-like protein